VTLPRSCSTSSPRGFTLLELLVATSVAAIVLLVINATFFGALRLHNTTHDRIEQDLVLQRALGLIQRDVAGLMQPGGIISGQLVSTETSTLGNEAYGERLSPDLYTTTGQVDGWNPFSEAQVVAYYLAPATDGSNTKSLVRVITRNLLPVQTATSEEQILVTGLTEGYFEFYDGTSWTDAWDSTATSSLPTAVRFSLTLAPVDAGQPAPSPVELVIPVPVMTRATQAQVAAGGST
jgi:general secretion pathway protein J